MSRYGSIATTVSGAAGAVATAVGSNFVSVHFPKTGEWVKIALIAVFPIVSVAFVYLMMNLLTKISFGRRILLGNSWMEGWWYLKTHGQDPKTTFAPGLMSVTYRGAELTPHIAVYRESKGSPSMPFITRSHMTAIREGDSHFLNYCVFPEEGKESRSLGVGNFIPEGGEGVPKRYEGVAIRTTDAPHLWQSGKKISWWKIWNFKRKYKDVWIMEMIKQQADQIPE